MIDFRYHIVSLISVFLALAVGIALGALLWSFLDQSSQILDLEGVPKEIVTIMQGSTVLSVVVAYELVRRYSQVLEQKRVGVALGQTTGVTA